MRSEKHSRLGSSSVRAAFQSRFYEADLTKGAIDETFAQIEMARLFDAFDRGFENLFKDSCCDPFLEPAMAALVG